MAGSPRDLRSREGTTTTGDEEERFVFGLTTAGLF